MSVNLQNNITNNGPADEVGKILSKFSRLANSADKALSLSTKVCEVSEKIQSVFAYPAIKDWQELAGNGFLTALPMNYSAHYSTLIEELTDATNCPDENGLIAVPVSVARFAMVGLLRAQAQDVLDELGPIARFSRGDYASIDLSTTDGIQYFFHYYLLAMGNQSSLSEFEELVDFCISKSGAQTQN